MSFYIVVVCLDGQSHYHVEVRDKNSRLIISLGSDVDQTSDWRVGRKMHQSQSLHPLVPLGRNPAKNRVQSGTATNVLGYW